MKYSVVVIGGPTASGKSALASDISNAIDGNIINGDSMQIYKELAILTDRPKKNHYKLYGELSGNTACSVSLWIDLAIKEIKKSHTKNKIPIIVGGTGFYLKSLINGISFIPDINLEIKTKSRILLKNLGNLKFHELLSHKDPLIAKKLHPQDSQRITRAWEVIESTGKSLIDWQNTIDNSIAKQLKAAVILIIPDKKTLHQLSNERIKKMIKDGAIEEVESLIKLGLNPELPIMKTIGVKELSGYIKGKTSLEEALTSMQTNTKKYIKRQFTWFKKQFPHAFIIKEAYVKHHALDIKNCINYIKEKLY